MNGLISIAQGFLIVAFLLAGGLGKLVKNDQMKENFKHLGYSTGFMYFLGVSEVLGAAGLLVGYWVPSLAALAAAGFVVVMAGAVVVHLRAGDGIKGSMASLVLLILSALVLWGRLP